MLNLRNAHESQEATRKLDSGDDDTQVKFSKMFIFLIELDLDSQEQHLVYVYLDRGHCCELVDITLRSIIRQGNQFM